MFRGMYCFDHLPRNVITTWGAISGLPVNVLTTGKGVWIDDAGAISAPAGNSSGAPSQFQMRYTGIFPADVPVMWLGWRQRVVVGPGTGVFLTVGDSASNYATLQWSNLPAEMQVQDAEFWMEVEVFPASGLMNFYANGTKLAYTYTVPAANLADLKRGNVTITPLVTGSNTSWVTSYRDFIIYDNLPGDDFNVRVGPRKVVPVYPDVVTGTGWNSTDGQPLLDTLKAPLDKATPGFVTNSVGASPLDVSLHSEVPSNYKIEMLQVQFGAKSDSTIGTTSARVKTGSSLSPAVTRSINPTVKYGLDVALLPKAPDGAAWTNAKIDATSLVITPEA